MKKYMSLPHLAQYYDLHTDTMKKRLKEIDMQVNEHFIILHEGDRKTIRFDVEKIHEALTAKSQPENLKNILDRLLI
ncbi:hypothetical protein [Sulfuricurvum sp.]|uniref:hypothetical protein n=1 Tax=Sulfuricurvum sp. TaxID=2025608 RepID=UPI003BB1827E